MRDFRYPLLILSIVVIVFSGCSRNRSKSADTGRDTIVTNVAEVSSVAKRGDKVPNFSWKDEHGKVVDYDSYHGKVTLINFWATWCGPCRNEVPDLISMSRELAGRNVKVIGISEDRGSSVIDDVKSFVKENGIPYQILVSNDELDESFRNVRMLPTSFIVNEEGTIVQSFVGIRTKEFLTQAIIAALK